MNAPNGLRSSLEHLATELSDAWVAWWSNELRAQSRPMTGGWPGTLSEARARVAARLESEPELGLALSETDLETLARAAYLKAKTAWLAQSVPNRDAL